MAMEEADEDLQDEEGRLGSIDSRKSYVINRSKISVSFPIFSFSLSKKKSIIKENEIRSLSLRSKV